jgi:hypothetical protein
VTVVDNIVPTITCPANITVNVGAGTCTATVLAAALGTPTTADNCSVASVSNNHPSTTYTLGANSVVWTVTDGSGNTATCTQTVTVVDNINPTITCPANITVNVGAGTCTATVLAAALGTPTTADNCSVATVTNNHPSTTYTLGANSVVWTVTDGSGNTATCTQTVTVVDNINPTITCPAAQTIVLNASCAGVLGNYVSLATVTDNCTASGSITVTQSPAPGTPVSGVGTTVITLTAQDASGNTSTCTFNVNAVDTTLPVLANCPANQAVSFDSNCEYTLLNYITLFGITASDNCSTITPTQSPAAGTIITGNTSITITAVDASGNTTTCTFDITPADTDAPVIAGCPANFNVNFNGACAFVIPDYITSLGISASDNCFGAPILTQSPVAGTSITTPTLITITAIDDQGNASICAFTITPVDTANPTIACPSNINVPADAGFSSATLTPANPTTGDNCSIASLTWTMSGVTTGSSPITGINTVGSQVFNVGVTTITYVITDAAGNTATCSFTVTVTDNQVPIVTCPANVSVNATAGLCEAFATVGVATAIDNEGIASITNDYNGTSDASDIYPVGVTVVTWTAIDNTGNSNTCTMTVTVVDTQAPVITCPAGITVNASAGLCNTIVNIGTASATDNCAIASITNNHPSTTYNVGSTTVIWTATDVNGNTSTCTQVIVVNDNQNPTITCPANITLNAAAGQCNRNVTVPVATASDNCGVASIVNSFNGGGANASGVYPVGTTTVTFTVTDINGNTASCSTTITINDNQNPTITCPGNITQNVTAGTCSRSITVNDPTYSDNCTVASVSYVMTGATTGTSALVGLNFIGTQTFNLGTTTITYTVTDIAGNTATCTQTVTVVDNINPTITCPANITVNVDAGTCVATVATLGTPVTADNCSVASVSNNHPSTTYTLGVNNIVWTVTDGSGNTATCTQTVTVVDNINPTITCPANITVNAAAGLCTAAVIVPAPVTADNCTVASVVNSFNGGGANASGTYPVGTTTVTFTVTDGSGLTASCSMTVTVVDNQMPSITCPANITIGTDAGVCQAAVTVPAPVTSDNCGVASVVNSIDGDNNASGIYPIGTTSITWTVTDIHGNVSTCVQTVTVNDDEDPIITTCPASQNVGANAACQFVVADYTGLAVATDNCDASVTITQSPVAGTTVSGTTTVTITATDDAGNDITCTFQLIVVDNTAPSLSNCPVDQTVNVNATCQYTLPDYTSSVTTSDNCSAVTVTQSPLAGSVHAGHGTVVPVTITATDTNGNATTCTFNVTLNDNINPVITCAANVTANVTVGLCTANVTVTAPATSDNCSVVSVINNFNNSANASGIYPLGTTTVIWTVTDIAGNSATCTQTVTVVDNINPTITCPANITVNVDAGTCVATVATLGTPVTADNCSVASVSNNHPSTTYTLGVNNIVWTVTDGSGNTATCTQTVTVVDNINPTITCPANITVNAAAGLCTAAVIVPAPVTADNCTVASVVNSFNGGGANASGTYPVGTTTVTFTVTDGSGLTASCSMTVIVVDNQVPSITCPANITIGTDAGVCQAAVTVPAPVTSDNCGVASVVNSIDGDNNASGIYPIGTTSITWTVTDIHGNVSTCVQTVTVNDDEDPIITTCPASQNVGANAACQFVVADYTGLAVATDNCDASVTITQSPVAGTTVSGTTTVTITATDDAGNDITCTFQLIVVDNTAPSLSNCPVDQTVNVNATCQYTLPDYTSSVTTSDNCSAVTVTQSPIAGSVHAGHGTVVPVNITATDTNGNATTCTFNVTLNDNINPVITCAANVTANVTAGLCTANVTVTAPAASDNCSVVSVINNFNNTANASGIYPLGTTTVIWTVTDIAGNSATCTQTITVVDNINPTITCPANITVNVDAGTCVATVATLGTPVTADNCSVASVSNNHPSTTYTLGVNNIVWTVTDGSGNTATCTQTVTVVDNINPTITCPANITVNAAAGLCTAAVIVPAPVTADNCTVASVVNSFNGGGANASGTYPVGTTTVTFTVTDGSGLTASCSMTVTVVDNQMPSITCPANITIGTDAGVCQAAVTVPAPVTSDNCGVASVVNSIDGTNNASGIYPIGTTSITWTVTDIHGNISTCVQTVTVNDDEDPIITCPADQNVNFTATCEFMLLDYTSVLFTTVTDNCDTDVTLVQVPAAGTVIFGNTTVTITATDDTGNSTSCSFDVLVTDDIDPVLVNCPANQAVFFTDDCDYTLLDYVSVFGITASDNCDNNVAVVQVPAAGTIIFANTLVTVTATDDSGNSVSCSFDVTPSDVTAPWITGCPANFDVSFNNNCEFIVPDYISTLGIAATDNCFASPVLVQAPAAGTVITTPTIINVMAIDDQGNASVCAFTITPVDTTDPVIVTCAADQNVSADANCEFTMVDYTGLVVVNDNCDPAVVLTQSPVAGSVIAGGTSVTITATDAAGNSSSCSFDVVVDDTTSPIITICAPDVTEQVNASCEFTAAFLYFSSNCL